MFRQRLMFHWTVSVLSAIVMISTFSNLISCATWNDRKTMSTVMFVGTMALILSDKEDPTSEEMRSAIQLAKTWAESNLDATSSEFQAVSDAVDVALKAWERYEENGQGDWRDALRSLLIELNEKMAEIPDPEPDPEG